MRVKTLTALSLAVLIVVGLSVVGCGSSNGSMATASPMPVTTLVPTEIPTEIPTEAPTPTETPKPAPFELTVIHTNDTAGYTEPCG